jgi:hypothetical protein
MQHVQSFAGTVLSNKNFKELSENITEQVLVEILSPSKGKYFVTPEQYVKKYNAPYRQVIQVLNSLVRKNILKPEYKTRLDTGRDQSYFYFKANKAEAETYARKLLNL